MANFTTPYDQINSILHPVSVYNPNPTPLNQIQQTVGNAYTGGTSSPSVQTASTQPTQTANGNDYQSQWTALGRSGTPPVGWHGESAAPSPADTILAAQKQFQDKMAAYDSSNPFSYDDALAKDKTMYADSVVNPYYKQLLGDYIKGINIARSQGLTAENNLVTKLLADKDAYTGQAKQSLDTALLQSGQQYSDAGSYDSGVRMRNQGVQQANSAYDVATNARNANFGVTEAQRQYGNLVQNQDYSTGIQQRNYNTQALYDTQRLGAAQASKDKAMYQYNRANSLGVPPGEDPIAYKSNLETLLSQAQTPIVTGLYSANGANSGATA